MSRLDDNNLTFECTRGRRIGLLVRAVLLAVIFLPLGLLLAGAFVNIITSVSMRLLFAVPIVLLSTWVWLGLDREIGRITLGPRTMRLRAAIVSRRRPIEDLILLHVAAGDQGRRRIRMTFATGAGCSILLTDDDTRELITVVEERLGRQVALADLANPGRWKGDPVIPRARLDATDVDAARAVIEAIRRGQVLSTRTLVGWVLLDLIGLVALIGGPVFVQIIGGVLTCISTIGLTVEWSRRANLKNCEQKLLVDSAGLEWDDLEDGELVGFDLHACCEACGYEHLHPTARPAIRLGSGELIELDEEDIIEEEKALLVHDAFAHRVTIYAVRCRTCGEFVERIEARLDGSCLLTVAVLVVAVLAGRFVPGPTLFGWLTGVLTFVGLMTAVVTATERRTRRRTGLPLPKHCPSCDAETVDLIVGDEPFPCPVCGTMGLKHTLVSPESPADEDDPPPDTAS